MKPCKTCGKEFEGIRSSRLYCSTACRQRPAQQRYIKANPLRLMLKRASDRAKERGFEFNLTETDLVIPDVCPVLGLVLKVSTGNAKPNSPALDRIDNTKGYVKGNVRVISNRANSLKSDATKEELKLLALDAYRRI